MLSPMLTTAILNGQQAQPQQSGKYNSPQAIKPPSYVGVGMPPTLSPMMTQPAMIRRPVPPRLSAPTQSY